MISIAAFRSFLSRPLRIATVVVAVLVVVAFAVAGWFGVSWYQAAHDPSLNRGMARDAVLQDARQAMINLNTIDYRRVQDGLTLWEQSSAGSLLGEMRANRANYARAITDSKTITTAKVIDAAVAALDEGSGTARVLLGVDVTSKSDVTPKSVATSTSDANGENCVRRRIQLDMRRDSDAWKVDKLEPIGQAHQIAGACPATMPVPPK